MNYIQAVLLHRIAGPIESLTDDYGIGIPVPVGDASHPHLRRGSVAP